MHNKWRFGKVLSENTLFYHLLIAVYQFLLFICLIVSETMNEIISLVLLFPTPFNMDTEEVRRRYSPSLSFTKGHKDQTVVIYIHGNEIRHVD